MGWINNWHSAPGCGPTCGCDRPAQSWVRHSVWLVLLGLVLMGAAASCNYSFTGASVAEDVNTFSVDLFQNRAPLVSNLLAPQLTEQVRQRFQQQSRLTLVRREGDIRISGTIVDYVVAPAQLQANNTAALNRLSMRVRVTYVNVRHPEDNFEQDFLQFVDFPATQTLQQVEVAVNQTLTDRLAQDIFNKALSNW